MSILDQIAFDQIADERDKAQQEIKPLKQHIKQLKEELMDVKNKHAALVADVALYEDRGERIKRLEEAGNMLEHNNGAMAQQAWRKAKEAKP